MSKAARRGRYIAGRESVPMTRPRPRRCRKCNRLGAKVVPIPPGFPMPEYGAKTLALCRWCRGADTRKARQIEAITDKLAEVLRRSLKIEAEGKRALEGGKSG